MLAWPWPDPVLLLLTFTVVATLIPVTATVVWTFWGDLFTIPILPALSQPSGELPA